MKIQTISLALIFTAIAAMPTTGQTKKPKKAKRVNPAMAAIEDDTSLPRVLLIGDSISIGYTVGVRQALAGKANVHRPRTNCGPTTRGIAAIDEWLKTGGEGKKWDAIHFNWGLHDLKYMGADGSNLADPKDPKSLQQVPPAEYEKNLRILAQKLKSTGAKVIWRNTTPVPAGAKGRVVGDSIKYNEIATKVMAELDIPTHDLFTLSKDNMEKYMLPKGNVHFNKDGNAALSQNVAEKIVSMLGK